MKYRLRSTLLYCHILEDGFPEPLTIDIRGAMFKVGAKNRLLSQDHCIHWEINRVNQVGCTMNAFRRSAKQSSSTLCLWHQNPIPFFAADLSRLHNTTLFPPHGQTIFLKIDQRSNWIDAAQFLILWTERPCTVLRWCITPHGYRRSNVVGLYLVMLPRPISCAYPKGLFPVHISRRQDLILKNDRNRNFYLNV